MSKYSFASLVLRSSLTRLGLVLTENDIRCLMRLTKDCISEAEATKKLRLLIAKYRNDPSSLLQIKGIGKKTFVSIINLAKEAEGQEAVIDTSANSNLDAALASIRLIKRRTGKTYEAKLTRVVELLNDVRVGIVNETLKSK